MTLYLNNVFTEPRRKWAKGKTQGRGRRRGKGLVKPRARPRAPRSLRPRALRSVSREHHVETLLVADASMVEFHHDGDVEMYLLTIMNIVSLGSFSVENLQEYN